MKRWSSIVSQWGHAAGSESHGQTAHRDLGRTRHDPQIPAFSAQVASNQGYDPEMGARPLRRVLQTEVEDQLAELLLKGQAQEGQTIKVGTTAGTIKFEIV